MKAWEVTPLTRSMRMVGPWRRPSRPQPQPQPQRGQDPAGLSSRRTRRDKKKHRGKHDLHDGDVRLHPAQYVLHQAERTKAVTVLPLEAAPSMPIMKLSFSIFAGGATLAALFGTPRRGRLGWCGILDAAIMPGRHTWLHPGRSVEPESLLLCRERTLHVGRRKP